MGCTIRTITQECKFCHALRVEALRRVMPVEQVRAAVDHVRRPGGRRRVVAPPPVPTTFPVPARLRTQSAPMAHRLLGATPPTRCLLRRHRLTAYRAR
jgi:hypothetical protein